MKIDLKDPNGLTIENVRALIESGNDSEHSQFRCTETGIMFLSTDVGADNLDGILFRLETNSANGGYVGKEASEDEVWVNRIYTAFKKHWPIPEDTYIDDF
ncbi:MAG: hypothetical protein R2787_09180 [Saprospiraceae bacterium]